jgi:hypothetical protein
MDCHPHNADFIRTLIGDRNFLTDSQRDIAEVLVFIYSNVRFYTI